MTTRLVTSLIEDAASLEALAPGWWELWRRCPGPTPFTSPAWLLPWWQVFAPGPLRTIAVHDGERLVALAPLYFEDGPFGQRLLPLGIGLSDTFDLLVDPAEPRAATALAEAVLSGDLGSDNLHLEELPENSAALAFPCPTGFADETSIQSARPVLALGSPDAPIVGIPSAKYRKLRMARHRTARRDGEVRAVEPDEIDGFLADLTRLHGARWAERGEAGVLTDARVLGFHEAALPRLAKEGLARLFRLEIEGEVAGCYYGLRHGDTAHAYLGGFDPAFAFESPGTVLIGHAIEASAREGARRFDFLRGREPYKYEWGAVDERNSRRLIGRANPDA